MAEGPRVTLDAATEADAPLLANLLELYSHDLSDIFPDVEPGPDGRFGYAPLPRYWAEPERRFAFLIKYGNRLAGFALVTLGSPAVDDPAVLDVAEFFVLRRYRREGVGRQAAMRLWERIPGRWTVRVAEGNATGLAFWREVIDEATGGAARESTRPGSSQPWRVFSFQTTEETR